ncbi:MAG: hypothetical protein IJ220_03335 [Clostridia bacterium]|nr:hypothetical protein [Clostridia bacterium]
MSFNSNKLNIILMYSEYDKSKIKDEDISFLRDNFSQILENESEGKLSTVIELINDKEFIKEQIAHSQIDIYQKVNYIQNSNYMLQLDEREYFQYLSDCILDTTNGIETIDRYYLMKELNQLGVGKEKIDLNDENSLTKFESLVDKVLSQTTIPKNINSPRIKELKNEIVARTNQPYLILKYLGNGKTIEECSREEYFQLVEELIQNKNENQLKSISLESLIKSAKNFKIESNEWNDSQDYTDLVFKVITENEDMLVARESLILSTQDMEFIAASLYGLYPKISLEEEEKLNLIVATNNPQLIDDALDKDSPMFSASGKAKLIKQLIEREMGEEVIDSSDIDLWKKYLENPNYDYNDSEKIGILQGTNNEELIKNAIESGMIKSSTQVSRLVASLSDLKYIEAYLNTNKASLDINELDLLYDKLDNEEAKRFKENIKVIRDVTELSSEELESMSDEVMVRIANEDTSMHTRQLLKKEEYIAIRKQLDFILEGIDGAEKGNSESELQTFLQVYQRLAEYIEYDEYACSKLGKDDEILQYSCRSLKGGILEGKSVCAGYAEILRNSLALKGVECKYVRGSSEIGSSGHAWNQVKMGDNWFNVDLTWDRNKIVEKGEVSSEVLKTDSEFHDHDVYGKNRTESEEKCEVSIEEASVKLGTYREEQSHSKDDANDIPTKEKKNLMDSIKNIASRFSINLSEIYQTAQKYKEAFISKNRNRNNDSKEEK